MSMESAKAFVERICTDAKFAKRAMEQRAKGHLLAFLKAEGYEFTEDEYSQAYSQAVLGGYDSDLSDEQLEHVAGGRAVHWRPPFFMGT